MKRCISLLVGILTSAVIFCGCGKETRNENCIVGTWHAVAIEDWVNNVSISNWDSVDITIKFTEDMEVAMAFSDGYSDEEENGTWDCVPTTKEDIEFMYKVDDGVKTFRCYFLKNLPSTLILEIEDLKCYMTQSGHCEEHNWNDEILPQCSICREFSSDSTQTVETDAFSFAIPSQWTLNEDASNEKNSWYQMGDELTFTGIITVDYFGDLSKSEAKDLFEEDPTYVADEMSMDYILGNDGKKYVRYIVPMETDNFCGYAYFISDNSAKKTVAVDYANYTDHRDYLGYYAEEDTADMIEAITKTISYVDNVD